jgi:RNA polymerase sigma-70 factor (ECF subfamily)
MPTRRASEVNRGSVLVRRAELDGCSDEQLLGRYARGELEAMEVLLARYKRPLFHFVLRLVRERGKAEDLLQESFLRMVEHASTYQGTASVKTWLFRIARNLCIDELRRQKHRRHPSLDAPTGASQESDGQTLYDRLADQGAGPDRSMVDRDLAQRMAKAIDELPEDQREVFVLRQVQNLSFKEIGEVTGVSENTVKSRMRYALERLQKNLSDYQEYAEELQ